MHFRWLVVTINPVDGIVLFPSSSVICMSHKQICILFFCSILGDDRNQARISRTSEVFVRNEWILTSLTLNFCWQCESITINVLVSICEFCARLNFNDKITGWTIFRYRCFLNLIQKEFVRKSNRQIWTKTRRLFIMRKLKLVKLNSFWASNGSFYYDI